MAFMKNFLKWAHIPIESVEISKIRNAPKLQFYPDFHHIFCRLFASKVKVQFSSAAKILQLLLNAKL